jgi:FkbM family methyltransferase
MKKWIQHAIQSCGWDFHRYIPDSTPIGQLQKYLELADIDIVYDIGANVGQFASSLRRSGFRGYIVSFEPLSTAREKLLQSASTDARWLVHEQCALGEEVGQVTLNVSANSESSSVLPMLELHATAAPASAYIKDEQVMLTTLDIVHATYSQLGSNLFLKLDTQGYEWQVLNGASRTLLDTVGILCELSVEPLYEGQYLWRDIIDRLEKSGFHLWALQQGFADPISARILQMDGIFFAAPHCI